MSAEFEDHVSQKLLEERNSLFAARSDEVWGAALKRLDPEYRVQYVKGYRKKAKNPVGHGVHSGPFTPKEIHEVQLFKRTLLNGAINGLREVGQKVTLQSIAGFLSQGHYSIIDDTVARWHKEVGSQFYARMSSHGEIIKGALLQMWSRPGRVEPPSIPEIAHETGLTFRQIMDAMYSKRLSHLRRMGPKRINKEKSV